MSVFKIRGYHQQLVSLAYQTDWKKGETGNKICLPQTLELAIMNTLYLICKNTSVKMVICGFTWVYMWDKLFFGFSAA